MGHRRSARKNVASRDGEGERTAASPISVANLEHVKSGEALAAGPGQHERRALVTRPDDVDVRTVITCAIDDIAMAALREQPSELRCELCEQVIEDDVPTTGLMMWSRGDDIRYDEPPLCQPCATGITISAWVRWQHPE